MGDDCQRLSDSEAQSLCPAIPSVGAALLSPHDLRVESRTAIPLLASWLQTAHGVTIQRGVAALHVESGAVHCSDGVYRADTIIVCPGDDWTTLYPEVFADAGIVRCKLQMLRLANPGWRMPAPVMSDLSLVRYAGYAALPEAAALRRRLEADAAEALAYGIHLIAVQSADGSLVVGDSHDYALTPDPFSAAAIDAEIVRQYEAVLGPAPHVVERWTGTYASGPEHSIVRQPADGVTLVRIPN